MRIAYVEDNPTNLALVERVAGMNHHVIVSYNEGEIALQELVREKFDLILMDVELAGEIGGLQVVKQLRASGLKTPIVAVTAYAMMGDRDKCLEAGCDDYLPKPLPITELLALLARYEAALHEVKPVLAVESSAAATKAAVAPVPAPVSAAPIPAGTTEQKPSDAPLTKVEPAQRAVPASPVTPVPGKPADNVASPVPQPIVEQKPPTTSSIGQTPAIPAQPKADGNDLKPAPDTGTQPSPPAESPIKTFNGSGDAAQRDEKKPY